MIPTLAPPSSLDTPPQDYPYIPTVNHLDYTVLDITHRLPLYPSVSELDVLNIGAGNGQGILSQQIQELSFQRLVNVEIFPDYLSELAHRRFATPDIEFINADALEYTRTLRDKSFDVALCFDVIEHFPKIQAAELLSQLIRVCRKQILIFLPFGTTPQDEYDHNPHQEHKSTWTPEDFSAWNVDICWRHFHIEGAPYAGFVSIDLLSYI